MNMPLIAALALHPDLVPRYRLKFGDKFLAFYTDAHCSKFYANKKYFTFDEVFRTHSDMHRYLVKVVK